jgi:RNA polymerase sigma factor (sigma-70 family)
MLFSWTDEKLITAIQKGGRQLDNAMYFICKGNRFAKPVFSFIRTPGGTTQDAEDIFQEGMMAFISNVERGLFKGNSSTPTYLYRICKNLWFKEVRKNRPEIDLTEKMEEEILRAEQIEIGIFENEKVEAVRSLMDKIDGKCRKLLGLNSLGYKHSEIAEELGLSSASTSSTLYSRCLTKMRQFIDDNPDIKEILR